MGLDSLPDEFKNMVQNFFHVGWLSTFLTALITLMLTALVSAQNAAVVSKSTALIEHLHQYRPRGDMVCRHMHRIVYVLQR